MPTPAFDTKAGTVENDCAGGKMGTSNLCNLASETNHLLQSVTVYAVNSSKGLQHLPSKN